MIWRPTSLSSREPAKFVNAHSLTSQQLSKHQSFISSSLQNRKLALYQLPDGLITIQCNKFADGAVSRGICILSLLISVLEYKKFQASINTQKDLSYYCWLLNTVCSFIPLCLRKCQSVCLKYHSTLQISSTFTSDSSWLKNVCHCMSRVSSQACIGHSKSTFQGQEYP